MSNARKQSGIRYIENDEYDNYLEYLAEEDDRRYEDEIFKRMSE